MIFTLFSINIVKLYQLIYKPNTFLSFYRLNCAILFYSLVFYWVFSAMTQQLSATYNIQKYSAVPRIAYNCYVLKNWAGRWRKLPYQNRNRHLHFKYANYDEVLLSWVLLLLVLLLFLLWWWWWWWWWWWLLLLLLSILCDPLQFFFGEFSVMSRQQSRSL